MFEILNQGRKKAYKLKTPWYLQTYILGPRAQDILNKSSNLQMKNMTLSIMGLSIYPSTVVIIVLVIIINIVI